MWYHLRDPSTTLRVTTFCVMLSKACKTWRIETSLTRLRVLILTILREFLGLDLRNSSAQITFADSRSDDNTM